MSNTEVIAFHGWGFDADCWQQWQELAADTLTWKNFDRGYFGEPQSPVFSDATARKIIIIHSFGLHQCSEEQMREADILIIFAGFLTFHPQAAQFRRRSKQVLNEMIQQFEDQPEGVLKAFYRNVYHPQKTFQLPQKEMNRTLLLDDLKRLDQAGKSLPKLKNQANIYIFQGTDDAIVPKVKGRALYEQFGDQAKYFEIKESGHALPFTHAEKCWQIIESEIKLN